MSDPLDVYRPGSEAGEDLPPTPPRGRLQVALEVGLVLLALVGAYVWFFHDLVLLALSPDRG